MTYYLNVRTKKKYVFNSELSICIEFVRNREINGLSNFSQSSNQMLVQYVFTGVNIFNFNTDFKRNRFEEKL